MIFYRSFRNMWCCKAIRLNSSRKSWCFMYRRATVPSSMSTVTLVIPWHRSSIVPMIGVFCRAPNHLPHPTRKGRATWNLGRCLQIPGSGSMIRLAPTWRNHPYINLYEETILGVWRNHPVFRILMMDPYQGKGRSNNIPHQIIYSMLWYLWFIFNRQVMSFQ